MKKLVLALVALMVASVVNAQPPSGAETYSCATRNVAESQAIDNRRADRNTETCQRFGLSSGCTQALVCATTGPNGCNAPGGASCTPAQARNAGCEIYPQSTAGRDLAVRAEFLEQVQSEVPRRDQQLSGPAYCNWFRTVASQAQRDADCAKSVPARPAGCQICPIP